MLSMKLIVLFAVLMAIVTLCVSQNEKVVKNKLKSKDEKKRRVDSIPLKLAMTAWAEQLTERDYSPEEWKHIFHSSSTSDFFNGYAKKLSKIYKDHKAKVNFAMIGACDGTGDNTIKYIYLPSEHWRGVFVEPMSLNVRDLVTFMSDKNVSHRSVVIRAAATLNCKTPTIKIERPLYEEKDKEVPHWLRRQINSILPEHRDHARNEWTIEEVKCMTGADILQEWSIQTNGNYFEKVQKNASEANLPVLRRRRPHVLKIDVEGHDYEVLMGFLNFDTPVEDLPLLIDFEGKSIAKKYPMAKERMEALGYAVSPYSHDGFAILKADKVHAAISALFKGLESGAGEGNGGDREGKSGEGKQKKRKPKNKAAVKPSD